jgi:hypothetical protein
MFDNLTNRLSGVLKTLRGQARLTESNVQDALREVRVALLEADVALPVVKDFIARVKERALGQDVVEHAGRVVRQNDGAPVPELLAALRDSDFLTARSFCARMFNLDARTNLGIQVIEEVKKYFQDKVYKTIIPRNVRLSEAPSHGEPIIIYDPKSRGAEVYLDLAKEVVRNG